MHEVTFPLKTLQNTARNRPDGYLEDILSVSHVDRVTDIVYIPADKFIEFRQKYNPESNKESTFPLESELNTYTTAGFTLVSDEVYQARYEKCLMCPFWDNKAYNNTGKCQICNCRTELNLRLSPSKCPVGYW